VLCYVDDAPELLIAPPQCVEVVRGGPIEGINYAVGLLRARATEEARARFKLNADDVVIVLDDDDFYHSRHFELTLKVLEEERAAWTGSLSMGLDFGGQGEAVTHVRADSGIGQHATWGFRLGLYDEAGGYKDADQADVALAIDMGPQHCKAHRYCTHVRRHHASNLSFGDGDRQSLRKASTLATTVIPRWSERCDVYERFCQAYLSNR